MYNIFSLAPKDMQEIYRGTIVNPREGPEWACDVIQDGALVVNEDGRIGVVGKFEDTVGAKISEEAQIIDLGGRIIMPGLVDTHIHLPQYPIIARYGESLLKWLQTYTFPAERDFTPERAAALAPAFFQELLGNGTTTASVFSTINTASTNIAFDAAYKAGIRAIIGKVMMDQNSPDYLTEDPDVSLEESLELFRRWNDVDDRLHYAFTPRFAPTCSRELMEATAQTASEVGAYIQTHLSENLGELAWVKELFPWAKDYTDVYEQTGLLGPKTILAHGIYLSRRELKVLKRLGCSIAHCPTSNFFLKSGLFPMDEVKENGIPIGLATDVGGGHSMSMFQAMRDAISMQTALSDRFNRRHRKALGDIQPENVIYLATQGGANALGMGQNIGSLQSGKKADFIVLDMHRVIPDNPRAGLGVAEDKAGLLSQIVFQADRSVIDTTVVNGKVVYQRDTHRS